MKHCRNCNIDYPDSIYFCTECGSALVSKDDTNNDSYQHTKKNPPKKRRSFWKILLFTLIALAIGVIAIINYALNAATYLRVEPNLLIADKNGGETKVDIDYDGFVWTINHFPDWIQVREFDDYFSIQAENNLTGNDREGSITIQSGKLLAQVIIQQKGYATYIRTSKTSLHFDEDGGTKYIRIDTDGCDLSYECPDYIKVSHENGNKFKIKVYSNSDEYRTDYLILKEDNIRTGISISQGGICNNCHGKGYVNCVQCMGQGGWEYGMFYSQCWACGGQGTFKCSSCNGSGKRE